MALPAELFATLLSISADAVVVVDDGRRIVFFNAGAERIFGYSAAEVDGASLAVLLPERFADPHRGHVRGFAATHGEPRLMGERQAISGRRKNGEEFPAEASIARLRSEGCDYYAAVLRDVSARARIERELRQAVTARDELLGIVSHELRNPVNAVKMLARGVAEGDDAAALSAASREQVAVIRLAAEQMDALIGDLLDVTRLESGRLAVRLTPVDPASLVRRAAETLAPLAEAAGLTFEVRVAPGLPPVLADPGRAGQVLSNLVGNAVKFTPAGGRVTLAADPSPDAAGGVVFRVSDTGEGIPAAQMPHIFERFWQGRAGGPRQGAGLGLPIAKGIVEAHGGRIGAESGAGGTTLWFTLRSA